MLSEQIIINIFLLLSTLDLSFELGRIQTRIGRVRGQFDDLYTRCQHFERDPANQCDQMVT